MSKISNFGKALMVTGAVIATEQANAQMALDHTVQGTTEQVYKTITFANGNQNNNPSYNYTGPKNIDAGMSDSYGGQPLFWRNTGGNGSFVDTHIVGGSSDTTVANEVVGGNTISWNQATALQKTVASNTNALGINFTGTMKRARADTNNDGKVDAQLTTYTLPSGTAAQAAGFQIGDIVSYLTPEIKSTSGGTLLTQQESYQVLNNNRVWEDTVNGPTGWSQKNIINWITEGLATDEVNTIKTVIYPNPTTDKVFIKLNPGQKVEQYQLINIAGQQLLTGKDMSNGVDVSRLPAGMYILQLKVNDNTITHKVIKK